MIPVVVTAVTADPIDVAALVARIRRPECGGLVAFEGSTRSPSGGKRVERLEYEAWIERAEEQLSGLAREAAQTYGLGGVVAVHRTGVVPIGEPSVLVAASSAHRAQAFEAARWLIDTIKAQASIWKKEIFDVGEAWANMDGPGRDDS
ncbi:MAG TPA: molybdenum cofactor biosynthesis protein MoaE [Actinomycetota bacterium]